MQKEFVFFRLRTVGTIDRQANEEHFIHVPTCITNVKMICVHVLYESVFVGMLNEKINLKVVYLWL